MKNVTRSWIPYDLKVGKIYAIGFHYSRFILCRFDKVTEKGYNFIVLKNNKKFFKSHMYLNCKNNSFYLSNRIFLTTSFDTYPEIKKEYNIFLRKQKIEKIINRNEIYKK